MLKRYILYINHQQKMRTIRVPWKFPALYIKAAHFLPWHWSLHPVGMLVLAVEHPEEARNITKIIWSTNLTSRFTSNETKSYRFYTGRWRESTGLGACLACNPPLLEYSLLLLVLWVPQGMLSQHRVESVAKYDSNLNLVKGSSFHFRGE